jgi:inner membrane protein
MPAGAGVLEDKMHQLSIRFVIVGGLVLVMLVPLLFVGGVAGERQGYHGDAVSAIANSWGGAQALVGPLLVVPVLERYTVKTDGKPESTRVRRLARVVVPAGLDIDVRIEHQFRHKAIYEVPVYEAHISVSGTFTDIGGQTLKGGYERAIWQEAVLVLGIESAHAIKEASNLDWAGQQVAFAAGTEQHWLATGIHASLPDTESATAEFDFDIVLRGTNSFAAAPVGSKSTMQLESTWPHPNFQGRYLPDRYEIRTDGFDADWTVHELARNLPDTWIVGTTEPDLHTSARVVLHDPVSHYHVIERGIKYGVLFIALTYLTFVCFELTTSIRFHYVQYGVVGIGLTLFYLTLLSLSEHMAFGLAYAFATVLLTGLISWYVNSVARSRTLTVSITVIVLSLYAVLFTLLKLEAFALLAGTAVLLLGLVALMYATRGLSGHNPQ